MPRPRKSKAQKIREMLAKGKSPADVAEAVDCTRKYVYEVRWIAKKPPSSNAVRARATGVE